MQALPLAQDFYIKNQNGATSNQNRQSSLAPHRKLHSKGTHADPQKPQAAESILRKIDTLQIFILKRI
jgi:hypothetical protein